MSNTLLPCPFCGSGANLSDDGAGYYKVSCANYISCPVETAWLSSRKVALKVWNRRADAVPVVRCKECGHYDTTGYPALNPGTGWCDKMDRGVHDDFYCSYGERGK